MGCSGGVVQGRRDAKGEWYKDASRSGAREEWCRGGVVPGRSVAWESDLRNGPGEEWCRERGVPAQEE